MEATLNHNLNIYWRGNLVRKMKWEAKRMIQGVEYVKICIKGISGMLEVRVDALSNNSVYIIPNYAAL